MTDALVTIAIAFVLPLTILIYSNGRIEGVNTKFEAIHHRFEEMNGRLESLNQRFDDILKHLEEKA